MTTERPDPRRKRHVGMTREAYLAALAELGLAPQSQRTSALLGVSIANLQRLQHGYRRNGHHVEMPVPDSVALLLGMYRRHGLPD